MCKAHRMDAAPWEIVRGPEEPEAREGDAHVFVWIVSDGSEELTIAVAIADELLRSDPGGLDGLVGQNVASRGREAVAAALEHGHLPGRITVSADGIWQEASALDVTAWGVEPLGPVPETGARAYAVTVDGETVGIVHVPASARLAPEDDVSAWIATRLDALQGSVGVPALRAALATVIELS